MRDSNGDALIDFTFSFEVAPEATRAQVIQALDGTVVDSCSYMRVTGEFEDNNTYDRISVRGLIYTAAAYASRDPANTTGSGAGYDFDIANDPFIEADALSGTNLSQNPGDRVGTVDDAKAATSPYTFKFNMEGIGPVTATQVSTYAMANSPYDEDQHEWWDYTYPYTNQYKTSYRHRNAASLSGMMEALEGYGGILSEGNGGSLKSGDGGYMVVTLALRSGTPYTYAGGTKSSDIIGTIDITIDVKATDTKYSVLQRIQDAFNSNTILDLQTVQAQDNSDHYIANPTAKESIVRIPQPDILVDEYDKWVLEVPIQASSEAKDRLDICYDKLTLEVLGIEDIGISTQEDAAQAMEKVRDAISYISEQRGVFGGYQMRLEHTQHSIMVTAENLQDAESRIRDTDMAEEVVKNTKEKIILEAGRAMLAQANTNGNQVLSMLNSI